jgi:hypothetical protein
MRECDIEPFELSTVLVGVVELDSEGVEFGEKEPKGDGRTDEPPELDKPGDKRGDDRGETPPALSGSGERCEVEPSAGLPV